MPSDGREAWVPAATPRTPSKGRPEPVQGAIIIRYLARSDAFHGIGEAAANKLWRTHGTQLYAILAGDDPAPLEPILGARRADELLAAWKDDLAERDVVVWLDENRFDTRLANKVIRIWGPQGAAKLRANPYVMLTFASWSSVDSAALQIGLAPHDPRRLVGAVEGALYERLSRGHTAASRRALEAEVRKLLGPCMHLAKAAIEAAVHDGGAVFAPDGEHLQPAGAAIMERYVEKRIQELALADSQGELFQALIPDDLLAAALADYEADGGFVLASEQRSAVRLALQSHIGLVLGGAGVGKTTVMRAVHAVSERHGRPIRQMALAGRATQRLREATGRHAYTIAGFLQELAMGNLVLEAGTLLIVDEASMLDLPTTYRILRALPAGGRLLLVGDPGQLPPIGFGLILHVLAGTAAPQVTLTKVHRQAASTGIPEVAAAIRAGDVPPLPIYDPDKPDVGVSVLHCEPETLHHVLTDLVADLSQDGENQILSPLRDGETGVGGINGYFHRLASPGKLLVTDRNLALGDPVIWTRNDWKRGLMNGALGRITDISAEGVVAQFDGISFQFAEMADLQFVDLAYAITVHKAQGSQFRQVIVPIFPSRILDRTLIYTALTRATHRVVFIGNLATLRAAVVRPPVTDMRVVGLFRGLSLQYAAKVASS